MAYKRARTSTTKRRDFIITVALHKGFDYDSGPTYHPLVAQRAILAWNLARARAGQPFLPGVMAHEDHISAWGSGDSARVDTEPVITYSGRISCTALADMPDSEVEMMLDDLAAQLGEALGQHRVEIDYCDRSWALQADA